MDSKEVLTLIQLALGKASVAFMSQTDGGKIVMPTEELLETANELCEAIMAMARKDYARIAELEAECARLTTERDASQAAMVDGALREADLLSRAEKAEAECEALRKDRERAKSEIEKAVELIQRWGCECEPMIGFTCGPCRVVEMIDAAFAAAKGE